MARGIIFGPKPGSAAARGGCSFSANRHAARATPSRWSIGTQRGPRSCPRRVPPIVISFRTRISWTMFLGGGRCCWTTTTAGGSGGAASGASTGWRPGGHKKHNSHANERALPRRSVGSRQSLNPGEVISGGKRKKKKKSTANDNSWIKKYSWPP